MTTAIERLEEMLDDKETWLSEAHGKIRDLEFLLSRGAGWALPKEVTDIPNLPLPRLEFHWTPDEKGGCGSYKVQYRMVRRHFGGVVETVPLGCTSIDGCRRPKPWRNGDGTVDLPIRDGVHACFDSAHLGLPLYAICPDGVELLDPEKIAAYQMCLGHKARREPNP